MTSEPHPSPSRSGAWLNWIRLGNKTVVGWAASLSWTRLFILCLVVLIASSWIADTLDLRHRPRVRIEVTKETTARVDVPLNPALECTQEPVLVADQKYVLICEQKPDAAVAPEAGASAPAVVPPNKKTKSSVAKSTRDGGPQPTLGGYVGDLASAAMVAFFAYLIAAKIIVRKTAESEAKVLAATSQAQHEALERQLVQARLKLLQAQVEPHFLFNTLAAVDYLIETDPPRASVMQKQLITYLRGALPQMREESSTLGRELSQVRAYLELLKMRIEDRLEFSIEVPEDLSGAVFPPMVLQSIVENAIKHGIEPKPEGGSIRVAAQTREGQLWVDISDTGVGLPDGEVFGVSANGTGLGLENIRKRLALLYPGASRIELRSESHGGTLVRLVIPHQTNVAPSHAT
ncbi:MAG: histidine kinase [Rhodoferax sp.]|nr:histidine kinase [Rhodoferax sp.]